MVFNKMIFIEKVSNGIPPAPSSSDDNSPKTPNNKENDFNELNEKYSIFKIKIQKN